MFKIMRNVKKIIIGLLGAIFILIGLYYMIFEVEKNFIPYIYLGIGTWAAGIIYYVFFPKYEEVLSLILGIIILHSGVILLLVGDRFNLKILGFLVFTAGIVVVLNSGFSEYLKKKKEKKGII
jgi:hypothetical protein